MVGSASGRRTVGGEAEEDDPKEPLDSADGDQEVESHFDELRRSAAVLTRTAEVLEQECEGKLVDMVRCRATKSGANVLVAGTAKSPCDNIGWLSSGKICLWLLEAKRSLAAIVGCNAKRKDGVRLDLDRGQHWQKLGKAKKVRRAESSASNAMMRQ